MRSGREQAIEGARTAGPGLAEHLEGEGSFFAASREGRRERQRTETSVF